MIYDAEVGRGTGRSPMHSEDFDKIARSNLQLSARVGLGAPCHSSITMSVLYEVKTKTLHVGCPQCGKLVAIIKVAERGTEIECTTTIRT